MYKYPVISDFNFFARDSRLDQLPSFFKKDGIFESVIRRTIGFNRERGTQ